MTEVSPGGTLLRVALDVWDSGGVDPRGVVSHRRQYARACALLARHGYVQVCYTGARADKEWLRQEGLLEHGTFRLFRIPGRLQRLAARLKCVPVDRLLGQPHLYHSFTLYPFQSGCTQIVGTLFDFVPMRVPEFVPVDFTLKQVQWCHWAGKHRNATWIANSLHTKQDALTLGRLHSDQVQVVELCADDDMFTQPTLHEIAATLNEVDIQQPYLLCVNTLNPRKNHFRLLEAWDKGRFAEEGWTLVLVGHGADHPLTEKLRSGGFEGVIWLGYVPRPRLVHLYYGCDAVVYPSVYEGFGISVAEAIVAGKAVLTSHRSPMAESAGNGAECVDPWDVASLECGLTRLISDPSRRRRLAARNWSRREHFSLQRMADDLLTAYQRILD